MKTKHLITIMLMVIYKITFSQYDYFKWQKTLNLGVASTLKVPGSGIAVDLNDRPFYLTACGTGGTQNRVYWTYGDLLGSAPDAAPTSNISFLADNYGNHVFYITSNNQIGFTEFLYSNWNWSYNGSMGSEPIAPGPSLAPFATNYVFYIRASDRKVCNSYNASGSSGFGPILNAAPSAAPFSNLILNDDRVFYITDNFQIGCLDAQPVVGWQNISVPNGPGVNSILPGSKIQVRGNRNSYAVFYVGMDQKIYQYTYNSSYSGSSLISDGAPLAMNGTDILTHSYNEVRYVGTDGNIQSLLSTSCGWYHYTVNSTCNITDPAIANGTANKIMFYQNASNAIYQLANQSENSGFVYRKGNTFGLNGNSFNPIGVNYVPTTWSDNNGATFYPAPHDHYDNNWAPPSFNNQSSRVARFNSDMAQIASMGFNSVRFNCFRLLSNPNNYTDPNLYFEYEELTATGGHNSVQIIIDPTNPSTYNHVFQFYDDVLTIAAAHNLKVKFFIGLEDGARNTNSLDTYIDYLEKFADHFKNNPTIYAYALLQEADMKSRIETNTTSPGYPSAFRGKGDICYYVKRMYDAMRNKDQNHLITLSVGGRGSVFSFDPKLMEVDFMSFHIYPEDPGFEGVKSNIQWISNVMKPIGKPWIIGETGFPGNNNLPNPITNTGSYADQKNYAQFILDEAFSAGASGLAWWQYRNVYWNNSNGVDPYLDAQYSYLPHLIGKWSNAENYSGLVAHDGSLKPVVGGVGLPSTSNVFASYSPNMGCTPMYAPLNFFNINSSGTNNYFGTVKDQNGIPIRDAVLNGYIPNPLAGQAGQPDLLLDNFTYSDLNGEFNLYDSSPVYRVWISAPGCLSQWIDPSMGNNIVLQPVECGKGKARVMTSIQENSPAESGTMFTLYPNPNNGVFNLTSTKSVTGPISIEVTDLVGKSVLKRNIVNSGNEKIDMSHLNSGIYMVKITGKNFEEMKKVIKQ